MSNNLKTQAMKRLLTIGLMLSAVFALTNCSEQLVTPEKEQINVDGNIETNTPQENLVSIPYEVYVNEPGTKTIASGGNTYWVDEATALANGLGKDAVDRVTIYTLNTEAESEFYSKYTCHGKYTYAGNKRFVGDLYGEIGETNNWYCLYPYNSSVAETGKTKIEETFVIGAAAEDAYTQIQLSANNKSHIAGKNYPMYGKVVGMGNGNPTFTMSHLSALVALKIVNETGREAVVINSAELSVPEISSGSNKQSEIKIVGEFKADFSGDEIQFTPQSNSSSKAILSLGQNFLVAPGSANAVTLYFAVCPFDASGKTLDINLNGNTRRVQMPKDVKFQAGKITTLTIPLSLEHTIETDGEDFLGDMFNCTTGQSAVINGMPIDDMIIIGSKDKRGSITITGPLTDVLNALPLGFFTASWNDNQAVLIIEEVKAYLDVMGEPLGTTLTRKDLAEMMSTEDDPVDESFFSIKPYPAGVFSDNPYVKHNLLILDEEPFHKGVTEEKADKQFLKGYGITVAGIRKAIIDGDNTNGDQDKLYNLLYANSSQIRSLTELPIIGGLIGPSVICGALQFADCTVKLRTADIGEEGATDPRVVMWGLDIKGDN